MNNKLISLFSCALHCDAFKRAKNKQQKCSNDAETVRQLRPRRWLTQVTVCFKDSVTWWFEILVFPLESFQPDTAIRRRLDADQPKCYRCDAISVSLPEYTRLVFGNSPVKQFFFLSEQGRECKHSELKITYCGKKWKLLVHPLTFASQKTDFQP